MGFISVYDSLNLILRKLCFVSLILNKIEKIKFGNNKVKTDNIAHVSNL